MLISMYDKVKLKDNRNAVIVEIYEQGKAYEADIEQDNDYVTETISHDDITEIL